MTLPPRCERLKALMPTEPFSTRERAKRVRHAKPSVDMLVANRAPLQVDEVVGRHRKRLGLELEPVMDEVSDELVAERKRIAPNSPYILPATRGA